MNEHIERHYAAIEQHARQAAAAEAPEVFAMVESMDKADGQERLDWQSKIEAWVAGSIAMGELPPSVRLLSLIGAADSGTLTVDGVLQEGNNGSTHYPYGFLIVDEGYRSTSYFDVIQANNKIVFDPIYNVLTSTQMQDQLYFKWFSAPDTGSWKPVTSTNSMVQENITYVRLNKINPPSTLSTDWDSGGTPPNLWIGFTW